VQRDRFGKIALEAASEVLSFSHIDHSTL